MWTAQGAYVYQFVSRSHCDRVVCCATALPIGRTVAHSGALGQGHGANSHRIFGFVCLLLATALTALDP